MSYLSLGTCLVLNICRYYVLTCKLCFYNLNNSNLCNTIIIMLLCITPNTIDSKLSFLINKDI